MGVRLVNEYIRPVLNLFHHINITKLLNVYRVDDRLLVRVTDTALSRDLFPNDYYCLGDNENRPVKWLAIESLSRKMFTPASDVVRTVDLV